MDSMLLPVARLPRICPIKSLWKQHIYTAWFGQHRRIHKARPRIYAQMRSPACLLSLYEWHQRVIEYVCVLAHGPICLSPFHKLPPLSSFLNKHDTVDKIPLRSHCVGSIILFLSLLFFPLSCSLSLLFFRLRFGGFHGFSLKYSLHCFEPERSSRSAAISGITFNSRLLFWRTVVRILLGPQCQYSVKTV